MNLREHMALQRYAWRKLRLELFKERFRAFAKAEGGAAAVFFVLSTPVWIGGLGLGAEVGMWYFAQQRLQNTADALADSLAGRFGTGASNDELTIVGNRVLLESGFDFTRGGWTFNVSPAGAPEDGTNVSVTLTGSVNRFLTRMFLEGDAINFTVDATARVRPATPGCILALARQGVDSLLVTDSASIEVAGCEVLANSVDFDAFTVAGGSALTTDCARVGGYFSVQGQLTVTCPRGRQEEAGFALDPYADLQEPNASNCTVSGHFTISDTNPAPATSQYTSDDKPIWNFCGGLTVAAIAGSVDLPEGIYIIRGGPLEVEGTNLVTGSGVSFYFAEEGRIELPTAAPFPVLRFSAPTSGTHAGILFFGGRANNAANQIMVGEGSEFDGAVYFPSSAVTFGAVGALGGCTQIIGNTVTLTGTWQGAGPCMGPIARPIVASRVVQLVE